VTSSSQNGEVKVMDFGIAARSGHSELTQVGIAVGHARIHGARADPRRSHRLRTDIFALGIVLYEMPPARSRGPKKKADR